jgi:hypothetical protein
MKGCDIKLADSKDRPCSFAIVADGQTPIFLDAEQENVMKLWMNALKNAAMGIYGLSKRTDFTEYYHLLAIPEDKEDELTLSFLTKQYRRVSLKAHPDKGGDLEEYERIQEAYNLIKSHLEEQEQAKLYDTIHYEVVVEKGGPGIGLGMLVIEDKKKAQIRLKSKQANIIIRRLDEAAQGDMMVGDVLVGIDDDNTVNWTLARVVQRLNDFRVPVGSTVRLTYARMVRKDGLADDAEENREGAAQSAAPTPASTANNTPNVDRSKPPPSVPAGATPSKGDGGGDYFASPNPASKRPAPRSNAPNYNAPTGSTAAAGMPSMSSEAASQDGYVSVIAYEAVKSVNVELTEQVEALQAQLKAEKSASEKLKADVVALSTACKKLKKEEMRLKLHIQQLMSNGGGTVSEDQMSDSMQNVAQVAGHIQNGSRIPQSPETQKYLDMVGGGAAQRNAISAAAAVDPTGTVLQKWALSGDPAMSKLSRLEERLRKMQESNVPFTASGGMNSSLPPPPPPASQMPDHGHGHSHGHYSPAPGAQPTLTAGLGSPPRQKAPVPTQRGQRN